MSGEQHKLKASLHYQKSVITVLILKYIVVPFWPKTQSRHTCRFNYPQYQKWKEKESFLETTGDL